MKSLMVAVFAFFLMGCSTMQSIEVNKRTRTYSAEYKQVFKAVVNYCQSGAFAITMADKELGIVNTDWKENSGVSKFFTGNKRAKINFSLKELKDGKSTKVVLTISAQEQGMFGTYSEATMSESQAVDAYNVVFDKVQKELESN